jgi:hypothetical protein
MCGIVQRLKGAKPLLYRSTGKSEIRSKSLESWDFTSVGAYPVGSYAQDVGEIVVGQ